jgi:mono/diheme cytochrome c family protein
MKVRYAALITAAAVLTGCAGTTSRQEPISLIPDMDYQDRYDPQSERPFFSDHRASRVPPEGTVARGMEKADVGFHTGAVNGQYVGRNPLPITEELLVTGQQRFNTYCSPCHDRTGKGRGIVAQRAVWIPTNLQEPRVKEFNDGEIFQVISQGRRTMPPYRFQITEADRWAIVAYVRALQRTTEATIEDVPADQRANLK